jgi:glycosyltransferase involved in cell wall biosynthesis
LIQERYPDATLTIAHDGCCRPRLEQLARDLKLKNTTFVGRVPHAQVPKLYDSADIYLTTPNIDCMPGSLLECFASGLPVAATKAGGIPYIATDRESALLVDLDDHRAVAARSIELLENPELVQTITNGGLREVQKYHWEPVRDRWAPVYEELAPVPA